MHNMHQFAGLLKSYYFVIPIRGTSTSDSIHELDKD